MSQAPRPHRRGKGWPAAAERDFNDLRKRYLAFIRNKAFKYASMGLRKDVRNLTRHDLDDFMQEGTVGLWRAWKAEKEKKSPAYYKAAVTNAMISYTRKACRRNGVVFETQRSADGTMLRHANGKPKVKAHLQEYRPQPSANHLFGGLLWGEDPHEEQAG